MRIGPFRTGNRAGARVRSFDLAKEARQMAKFKRCPFTKTIANCSNSFCHFYLISSVSRPQRPLIMFVSCAHGINTARHSHILNPGKMYSVTSFISTYGLLSILNYSVHHAEISRNSRL